jgi:photosystem II stability/assembly factor-like uncharacterized protein
MKTLIAFALLLACVASGCSSSTLLQWQYTGGPVAQNVTALVIDQENPATLYAGLISGEIYRSSDRGQTWSRFSTVRGHATIYRLLQHPETRARLYALSESGVYVSSDRGKDWDEIRIVAGGGTCCRAMAIDPFKTSLLYVGLRGRGIFRSTDDGATWRQCTLGVSPELLSSAEVYDIVIHELQPDIVYAAIGEIGVVKSTDAGMTWARVTDQVTYPGTRVTAIALQRKLIDYLCIGADDGNIYRSTDGGVTWASSRRALERDGIFTLASDELNPQVLYAGTGSGLIISPDFGVSWRQLSLELPRCATHLVLSPDRRVPALYAFGQGVGVQLSTDQGKDWAPADAGLGGSSVSALVGHTKSNRVYGVVGHGVYAYDPGSHAWRAASSGMTGGTISSIAIDKDLASMLYVGTANGIFQSTDAGMSWQPFSSSLRFTPILYLGLHPSIRTRFLASTEQGILASTDMGVSWMRARPSDTKFELQRLTFSPLDAGRVYGATANNGIIVSSDGGLTWNMAGHSFTTDQIAGITLDPSDDRISYAWTAGGAGFRSADEGSVWRTYSVPWASGDTVRLATDRDRPSDAVAVLKSGRVFSTSSGGATWTEIPAGKLPDEACSLYWHANTGILYAGTRYNGVYEISLKPYLEKVRMKDEAK